MWESIRTIFVFLGFFGGLWHGTLLISLEGSMEVDSGYEVSSSLDGKYLLVKTYSVSRGGALGSTCKDSVFVFSSIIAVEEGINTPMFEVYSGPCDSFLDNKNSPQARWSSARAVEIEFSINGTRFVSHDVTLKAIDVTGEVFVQFVISK